MPAQVKNSGGAQSKQLLEKKLQLYGYSANYQALTILEDHFTLYSSIYESIEDYVSKINYIITYAKDGSSLIGSDSAFRVIQKLCNQIKQQQQGGKGGQSGSVVQLEGEVEGGQQGDLEIGNNSTQAEHAETAEPELLPASDSLTIRVKNVLSDNERVAGSMATHDYYDGAQKQQPVAEIIDNTCDSELKIHQHFLFKRLASLPVFKDFKLTTTDKLTSSREPSIKCICFGLLVKDISKIDGYLLIDHKGRVPVRITPDTTFRNRLAYSKCIVLIEGVYVNPADVLYAANIGLPPVLLDQLQEKRLICQDEKMIILLKEIYLDDLDIQKAIELLFTGYDSLADPPLLFILIGDFTRRPVTAQDYRQYTKKFLRHIRGCDNLKKSHFVFVPGQQDTSQMLVGDQTITINNSMPKRPLTKDLMPVNILHKAGFKNVHLATNPTHICIGGRQISVVCQSYFKELKKNLLHNLSDRNEELFETAKRIILSNGHLSAGISSVFPAQMRLWHRPDLLVLADSEAIGRRYEHNSCQASDTTFMTMPSFSRQSNQFKVYYLRSGEIEDSEVSLDALREIEEIAIDDDDDNDVDHSYVQQTEDEVQLVSDELHDDMPASSDTPSDKEESASCSQ